MRSMILVVLMILARQALAADYYVSLAGNDSAAGTQAQPWRTVNRALTGRAPGDVVHLQAGATFTENVTVASGGTAGLPVTLTSDPTNRATIRQASSAVRGVYIYNKGYITLENLIITGVGKDLTSKVGVEAYADNAMYNGLTFRNLTVTEFYRGYQFMGYGGGSLYGFNGILMENCEGSYNRDAGALTWGQAAGAIRNLTVRDCQFNYNLGDPFSTKNSGNGFSAGSIWDGLFLGCVTHDNGGLGNATEGPVGIMVYDSKRVTIQHCESYRNQAKYQDGDGFDLDLGASDCIIQYCYSHDNYGAGILLSTDGNLTTWTNNIVRYNISENDGTGGKMGGLHLYSPGTVAPLEDTQIYGNTIYSNLSPTVWFYSFANMTGIKLRNNIFATSNGYPLVKFEVSPSPTTAQAQFQGNAYWTYGGAFNVAGYTSLAAWRSAKGQEMLNGSPVGLNVNPMLVNAGGGGTIGNPDLFNNLTAYKLQAGSPMINAGLDLTALFGINPGPTDFYLAAIPQSGAYDIGAAEYVTTAPPTVPADPTGLSVSLVTETSISLAWTDNASNETGYQIERSSDGVSFAVLASVAANITTYANSGLPNNATYYYRVRAFNGAGNSGYSGVVSATTLQPQPPAAPTGLNTPVITSSSIGLAWTDQSTNESGFRVERSTDGANFAQVGQVGANVTTFTDSGLSSGATYHYRVRAYNAAGNSAYSGVASATTLQATPPPAPTGLTATAASQRRRINLAWNASSGATSYTIKRSTTSGGPYTTVATGVTATNYANTNLTSRTTYYYVVTAVNANGESPNSNQASATAK